METTEMLELRIFQWDSILSRSCLVGVILISLIGISSSTALGQAGYHPALFGSKETPSPQTSLFPKWRGTLKRYFSERHLETKPCESGFFSRCHLQEWTTFLKDISKKPRLNQIHAVNAEMNRTRYVVDPRNYGVPDYWATPHQFLRRDGDCEDYAITKYLSLRALGVPPSEMRILVVQDLNLQLAHAILIVYHNGRALILYNQIKTVVDTTVVQHYKPIYSINEYYWWLHRS
ncbi:MAG: hypothetical protein GKS01_08320 [Alphaproteobacteria bacterium]|nr:hypothetical protein [Alphaproteobacteria bacterium]